MKKLLQNLTAVLLTASSTLLQGAGYEWSNFVGKPGGRGNADGTGPAARFDFPFSLAVDAKGNVFVADYRNNVIRKITPAGVVTTFAGQAGRYGHADGTGNQALFNNPAGIVIINGTLYIVDGGSSVIRKITAAGVVTTLAGKANTSGSADGTGEAARFSSPQGIAKAADGSLLVTDGSNHTLRKVTLAGVVTTLAGQAGVIGSTDGTLSQARFKYPGGIATAADGTIFIADTNNHTIRKITPAGVVSTLAGSVGVSGAVDGVGSAARFDYPEALLVRPNGDLYVADANNSAIRRVTQAGEVTTIIGKMGEYGTADGIGTDARLGYPQAITADSAGRLYIADGNYDTIRRVGMDLAVTTFAGLVPYRGDVDGTGDAARFNRPSGISLAANGEVFIADSVNYKVRKVTSGGVVTTFAGTGVSGGADGPVATATLGFVYDTAVDAAGNVYVVDGGYTIRKIDTMGQVTTLAGMAGVSGTADGMGAAARFNSPRGIAVAADGTLYVADQYAHTIRKITPAGEVSTLAGQAGAAGHVNATGTAARFSQPVDVAVGADGAVYVADHQNNCIRKISPAGDVSTLAGNRNAYGSADGIGTVASFRNPAGLAVDPFGNIIVCDQYNHTIRRISLNGAVTTIGGSPLAADGRDGADLASRFAHPMRVAIDSTGVIYVVDYNNNRVMKGVPHPEITVEAPVGENLLDGASSTEFGEVSIHQQEMRSYTITNVGGAPLTGLIANVTGTHASDFQAEMVKPTLNPGETVSLTVTYLGTTVGMRTATLSILSNDADESSFDITLKASAADLPMTVTVPASQVLVEGVTLTFTAQGTHPTATVTYQWLKNGVKISGATSATYTKTSVKLTDGGTYTVEMKTNGFTTRRSASLVVAKYVEQSYIIKTLSTLKLSVSTSGPATYAWTSNNLPLAGAAATLTTPPWLFGTMVYRCHVSAPGATPVLVGVFNVFVYDSKPALLAQNLPDGAVGKFYSHQIAIQQQVRYRPSSYSASGLPPGVSLNTKTGLISGTPTVAKDYDITVTATNLLGSSSTKERITIAPLPTSLIGTYTGIVARSDFVNPLGGRVDLTITNTAAISGSVVSGTSKHAFKGQLVIGGVNPTAVITVPRGKASALTLTLVIDQGTQTFIAGSRLSTGMFHAAVSGWRLKWKAVGNPATTVPKLFTFGLRPPTGLKGIPAGDGYGSFTLPASGQVSIAGKLPDGTAYTSATFVGPQGQIGIFKTLHSPVGSLLGTLDIDPANNGNLDADVLEGSLSWLLPANAKSRLYPAGFEPIDLTAFGGRHTLPDFAPGLVLNMLLDDKAVLTFAEGGLSGASINPDVPEFSLLVGNKPQLPAALSVGNPGGVKITKLDAKTGLFTGTFTLEDMELRTGTAFAGKKLKRTATFSGIFTEDSMGLVGVGHFLLPEMPVDAVISDPPIPATTPTTTKILSGNLIMEKKM